MNWGNHRMSDGPDGQVFREAMATGAVISGRRTSSWPGAGRAITTTAYRFSC